MNTPTRIPPRPSASVENRPLTQPPDAPRQSAPRPPAQHNDTEQRLQAQFEKLEQQFVMLKEQTRQAQKLASLGTAAAMLAHEFNNMMSPVVGYARYAINSGDPELMIKALELTLKQTGVVTAMSDRILGLAANEARTVERVNVAAAIDDAVACLCRDLSKDGITLTNDIDPAIHVSADPRQLQQVLFNLLLNARQAIAHRSGKIRITADKHDDRLTAIHVADNGSGIPEDMLADIFDAFYTTKTDRPNKSGSGLGLTLCREIIEEHGGRISVESTVGEGTTFTFTLPTTI